MTAPKGARRGAADRGCDAAVRQRMLGQQQNDAGQLPVHHRPGGQRGQGRGCSAWSNVMHQFLGFSSSFNINSMLTGG